MRPVDKLMKERTSGNDIIKSSFDSQIADILARLETKVEREVVEHWREKSKESLTQLEERVEQKCESVAGQQQQFAAIFSNVEESIQVYINLSSSVSLMTSSNIIVTAYS
jgi:hypothetical protein